MNEKHIGSKALTIVSFRKYYFVERVLPMGILDGFLNNN
jgi:hypothetical protein